MWSVIGYTQTSIGLSGSVSSGIAPDLYGISAAPSMRANSVAYDKAYDDGAFQERAIMPPVPAPGLTPPAVVSKIIKTADLTMLVEDVDVTARLIDAVRAKLVGQIGNSSFTEYGSTRRGDVTIWVPSDSFDIALLDIKKGAIRVTNESIIVTDVSAQFVDIEARLKNFTVTETRLQELMQRSGSIPDVLAVSRELSQVRQSIEQLQGQLDHLSRQVALSSIHISLTQELAAAISENEWRPVTVVRSSWREMIRGLTEFVDVILVLVVQLPLLLLKFAFWGALVYGIWRGGKFVYIRLRGQDTL